MIMVGGCQFSVDAYLKEPREHVGWLAPDDKEARVELPKVGVQVLQTLEEKPEEGREIFITD